MTDNRTTELLRKLLDERGVKWWETINHANCVFTWWESPMFGIVHAMDNEDGETLFMACLNSCDFTPDQAIAATLGSEPPYDELLRCLENDWHIRASWDGLRKFWCIELTEEGVKLRDAVHDTLTAEQVRKATYAHSIHADCADADWQAIAEKRLMSVNGF